MSADDAVLLLSVLFGMLLIWRWHRDPTSTFDIRKVILNDTGEVSLGKLGQAVALVVSTWVLIHETRAGKLTEFLFTGYMISWAAANLVSKGQDLKAKADAAKIEQPAESSSSLTQTTTIQERTKT